MKSDQWIVQVGPYKIAIDRTFGNHPAIYEKLSEPKAGNHVSVMQYSKDAPVVLYGRLIDSTPE